MKHRYFLYFITLTAIIFIFRLFYINWIPLSGDEAQHWLWAWHPALCYYEHPPMIAYIIRFFTQIGTSNQFFIRLGSVLASFGLVVLVFLLTQDIFKKEKISFYATLPVLVSPLFSIGSVLATTDSLYGFFWMLTLYFLGKVFFQAKKNYWYLAGISLGLGLLSKFMVLHLLGVVILFLFISRENRFWFFRKEPYLALAIAVAIFSPVLWWNGYHHWATFAIRINHDVFQTHSLRNLGELILSQNLALTPFLFFFVYLAVIIAGVKGIIYREEHYLFLFCASIVTIGFFFVSGIYMRIGPHWLAGGYLVGFIAVSGLLFNNEVGRFKIQIIPVFKFCLFLTFIATALFYYLPLNPLIVSEQIVYRGEPEGVNAQRLKEIFLYRPLAERVKKELALLPTAKKSFVLCRSHGMASLTAFYLQRPFDVFLLNLEKRNGGQFNLWEENANLTGANAVFVCLQGSENIEKKLLALFHSIEKLSPLEVYRQKKLMGTFDVYRCLNFRGFEYRIIE